MGGVQIYLGRSHLCRMTREGAYRDQGCIIFEPRFQFSSSQHLTAGLLPSSCLVSRKASKHTISTVLIMSQYEPPQKGWLSHLPRSWVPYVQLARLSPPAGLFLIYFPHLFGTIHAALVLHAQPAQLLRISTILFGGSFFLSNAIHIWNDIVDAPLDALVARTRHRPIPRGAVSPFAASVFTATQAVAGMAFFLPLGWPCFLWSLPCIALWVFYPYAKRLTHYPQVFLGVTLAWGVPMGQVAMGFDPLLALREDARTAGSAACLFLASTVWTVVYDTIYAHQDLKDDVKAGIKSMAVLYQGHAKSLFWKLVVAMTGLLGAGGYLAGLGAAYYTLSVATTMLVMGAMVSLVQLDDEASCWWWFTVEFWFVGGAITSGLLGEYAVRHQVG